MKKSLSILLLLSVMFTMFATAGHAAGNPPKLFLNGTQLFSDVDPLLENGVTYVPVAILSEGLGYKVSWDGTLKKVTIQKDATMIEMIINEKRMNVNGNDVEMNAAPRLLNWRTLVPVRIVGELLGLEFDWKEKEREVHMSEPVPQPEPETPVEPPVEEVPIGYISDISINGNSQIVIAHSGVVYDGKPIQYESPKRLVFDFRNTTYLPHVFQQFTEESQAKVTVASNPLLNGFRYSQFQTSPLIARLVIEIGEDAGYVLTQTEGEIVVSLMPSSDVPVIVAPEPETPIEPEAPVEQPPTDDGIIDIVIDAGHGAKDPGAYSKPNGKYEKEFNLSLALKLKAELEKDKSFRVHMTRSDDTFLELNDRVKFAENVGADLFISIHANSFTKDTVSGTETYYERPESKAFAEIVHKHLLKGTGLTDRGVKKAAFRVIKDTTMPAILLEVGYLSSPVDSKVLFDEKAQTRIAVELANGIKEYAKSK
ncbi:N-acetylmuramoyl-L-alanine amidase [Paenibacillus sp. CAU 1782]